MVSKGWHRAAALLLAGLFLGAARVEAKPQKSRGALHDAFYAAYPKEAETFQQKTHVHTPLKTHQCAPCHASPQNPKQLTRDTPALCLSCHPERRADLQRPYLHPPFQGGDCGTCHDPHASAYPAHLIDEVKSLCALCHPAPQIQKAHQGVTVMEGPCTACHTPHGADRAKLIRAGELHPPFEARQCEACHAQPGPDGKAALRDSGATMCLVCHTERGEDLIKQVVHMPFQAGECWSCHAPHIASHRPLLKNRTAVVCRQCHEMIPEWSHPVVGHPTEQAGRTNPRDPAKPFDCTACHNPHGSAFQKLLQVDPKGLCLACHAQ